MGLYTRVSVPVIPTETMECLVVLIPDGAPICAALAGTQCFTPQEPLQLEQFDKMSDALRSLLHGLHN